MRFISRKPKANAPQTNSISKAEAPHSARGGITPEATEERPADEIEPPNSPSREELLALIDGFGYRYQRIYLGKGIYTIDKPQLHNVIWDRLAPVVPRDLRGARVLDVGCNAGFFLIQLKLRNAGRAIGLEIMPDYLRQAEACRRIWDMDIEYQARDCNDLDSLNEQFDIVVFTGILYHLKAPLLTIESLGRLCNDAIVVETEVIVEDPRNCVLARQGSAGDTPVTACHKGLMKFVERDEFNGDPSNWWIPDTECVMGMLRTAGFKYFSKPCYSVLQGRLLLAASRRSDSLLDLGALSG